MAEREGFEFSAGVTCFGPFGSDGLPARHSLPNGSNPPFIKSTKKEHPLGVPFFCGGERGIRTLGRVLADTRFPVVRLRPAQPSLQVAHSLNMITYRKGKINSL